MKKQSSPNLYELNLPSTLPDFRGKVPITMSAESVLARFNLAREALPREVTVLNPLKLSDYPESNAYEVFVSPDGSDDAEGTKDSPLASLSAALDKVKGKGGATITCRGGTYPVTSEIKVDSSHSGKAGAPLIIRSYEGETAKFTSNTLFSSSKEKWRVADPAKDPVAARLPKEAQGKVLYTTLSEHGLTADDIPPIRDLRVGPPSLNVGGEEYTLARYPNKSATIKDLLFFYVAYDAGRVTRQIGSDLYWSWIDRANRDYGGNADTEIGWQIRLLNGQDGGSVDAEKHAQFLLSWVNTGNIWYYGSTFEGFEFGNYNLADKTEGKDYSHYAEDDAEEKTPLLGSFVPDEKGPYTYRGQKGYYSLKSKMSNSWGCKHSINSPVGRNTYYLYNAIEALDEPGEWFYDKETGIFYIYPKDENTFFGSEIGCSNKNVFIPIKIEKLENAIIDGISIDGSSDAGMVLEGCHNIVIQHIKIRNTKKESLGVRSCTRTAVIYSDFSASCTNMLYMQDPKSHHSLIPTFNMVQNCFFHDPKPTRSGSLALAGCRTVASHNYFRNVCMYAENATEFIVEYNRFEGGSADIVDGGMFYVSGAGTRGGHVRYNLFHMFNETHNAIYNDTMTSGCYAYYNVICTLNSKSNLHKGWYSSTGHGNVCFGNIMVLRDSFEVARTYSMGGDEDNAVVVGQGDGINQSPLFYFYFGDEHAAENNRRYELVREGREEPYKVDYDPNRRIMWAHQALAGDWWEGLKKNGEIGMYLNNPNREARERIDPAYINHIWGTRLVLDALENSDYRIKYFYLPARLTGKTYTCTIMKPGVELLIPAYTYLDDNYKEVRTTDRKVIVPDDGRVTLTYEEIGAMERLRRAPAFCVIQNNIFLGGTPIKDADNRSTGEVDEELMINDGAKYSMYVDREGNTFKDFRIGYTQTALCSNNFLRLNFKEVTENARSYDYTIRPEAIEEISKVLEPQECEAVLSLDPYKSGPTYGFDYEALGPVQKN